MKQTKIIIATVAIALMVTLTSVFSVDVMNKSNKTNVSADIVKIDMTASNETPLTTTQFAKDVADMPEVVTTENGNGIVIETNESVKTTKKKAKKKKKKKKSKYKYIGTFKVTGYCACAQCNGNSSGLTACGTRASAGRTIAADRSKFSFGTKLKFNGHTYTVEDTGGAIKGNRIDLFFSSHSQALSWGVRYKKVYVKRK